MKIIRNPKILQREQLIFYSPEHSTGFVPTMGALHEGHLSLIRKARKENDRVVVSIFVNSLQFGPKEDIKNYPRTFSSDKKLCIQEGVDILFFPHENNFYKKNHSTYVEVTDLTEPLCGADRPGHFRGVTTVVLKLLEIVRPQKAYFGKKDYQQFRVIERMVHDLALPVVIRGMPLIREKDGLAMSSRNKYLSRQERKRALSVFRVLKKIRLKYKNGERKISRLKSSARQTLIKKIHPEKDRLEYAEILNPLTLQPARDTDKSILIALAVKIGKTRLIDNMELKL